MLLKDLANAFPACEVTPWLGIAQIQYTSMHGSTVIFGVYMIDLRDDEYSIYSEFKYEFSFVDEHEYEEYRILKSKIIHFIQSWYIRKDRVRSLFQPSEYYINDSDYIRDLDAYKKRVNQEGNAELVDKISALCSDFSPESISKPSAPKRSHSLLLLGPDSSFAVSQIQNYSPYPVAQVCPPSVENDWYYVIDFDTPANLEEPFISFLSSGLSKLGYYSAYLSTQKK